MIKTYRGGGPKVDGSAFIAETAVLIGEVEIGPESSVWYGAVLRGDNDKIIVGKGSSVQDNCVCHCNTGLPITIGDNCTVGHSAILHSCTIGDNCLIGMGSTIMNRVVIGNNCMVGAGALVTQGTVIPDNSLVIGSPARVVRPLKPEELGKLKRQSPYVRVSRQYLAEGVK